MIVVRNINTNENALVPSIDFDENYVGVAKGLVTVKNKLGQTLSVTKEEFDNNNNFVGVTKNTILVEHRETGVVKRFEKDKFDESIWTTNLTRRARGKNVNTAIKVGIYDSKNNLRFIAHGNFEKTCKDNNLPITALANSYKHNGERIFENIPKGRSRTRLINKGLYAYKGWYATKAQ